MAERGVRRALASIGLLPSDPATPPACGMRAFSVEGAANYVYCLEDGLFEPYARLEEDVAAGQPAGALHFPGTPWRPQQVVTFEATGMVLCRRFPGWARRGDCLFQLASPVR
jgi:predicted deacylase